MSQEGKDEKAALEEFMEVFESEDKKLEKEQKKLFIKNFRAGYRKVICKKEMNEKQMRSVMDHIISNTKASTHSSLLDKGTILGDVLGQYFALIEILIQNHLLFYQSSEILKLNKEFAEALHGSGIKPKKELIKKRLQKIALKHRGELHDQEKKTLASMANHFVS